ncbi:MAG: type IV pilus assembly protein PilM [Elusimicrobia bacterium]|nr:type IV pilus assembly protein PilM [Elusimicrobiota bacterium]
MATAPEKPKQPAAPAKGAAAPVAAPAKAGGVASITNKVKGFFLGSREVIGVDVGSHSIKVAYFKTEGGITSLKTWGVLPLDLNPEASPEQKKQQAVNLLRAFLIQKGVQVKEAATSISGNSVIVRYVKFPKLNKDELWATLATEAEPFIPFDIKDVQLGFHILGDLMEEGQKKMETVLVAAKKDAVQGRVEVLEAAGLKPTIIDVDSFALETVFEKLKGPKDEGAATLYLNIGHTVTNLSIIESGVTRVVRDVFISGISFTKAIMKALQLDIAKAEEAKKKHGLIIDAEEKEKALQEGNREALGVSQAISGVVRDLVAEVHRSVDFYLSQGPERSIGRIQLAGGSARMRNLAKHLTGELKVPVDVMNPCAFLKTPTDVPTELQPALGVVVGLALRSNKDWV